MMEKLEEFKGEMWLKKNHYRTVKYCGYSCCGGAVSKGFK